MNYQQQNFVLTSFKILANANRIKIIDLLSKSSDGKLTVNDIALKLNIEANTASNHLVRLRELGILQAKQNASNMYYSIKDQRLVLILNQAIKLA